jgi:hypothetical protein
MSRVAAVSGRYSADGRIIHVMHWSSLAASVLTAVGLVIGWILAVSLCTQARVRVYEKRLEAYSGLWHALKDLPVGNKNVGDPDDIDGKKREELANALTAWYYGEKGGLLTEPTRCMWQTSVTTLQRPTTQCRCAHRCGGRHHCYGHSSRPTSRSTTDSTSLESPRIPMMSARSSTTLFSSHTAVLAGRDGYGCGCGCGSALPYSEPMTRSYVPDDCGSA